MIDGSEKRNRQLAFELQNSHVCEKGSNCYSVAIRAKQSGTAKAVEHSKSDYRECSKQVSKDWLSGKRASQIETEML